MNILSWLWRLGKTTCARLNYSLMKAALETSPTIRSRIKKMMLYILDSGRIFLNQYDRFIKTIFIWEIITKPHKLTSFSPFLQYHSGDELTLKLQQWFLPNSKVPRVSKFVSMLSTILYLEVPTPILKLRQLFVASDYSGSFWEQVGLGSILLNY